ALEHVRRGPVGAERELDAPGAVSQIDEDEAAEVAAAADPAGEADAVAGVFTAQSACQRAAQRGGQAMADGIRENVTGYLTGPGCSGAFRVAQGTQEVIGIARGDEPLADLVPADEPGDAAERLDVRARGGVRTDEHEEQLDRLAVQRVEVHGLPREPGSHAQIRHSGRLAMRDRDAVPDPGGKNGFAFPDGAEHVLRIG